MYQEALGRYSSLTDESRREWNTFLLSGEENIL
jgi:hypothetical protein